MTRPPVAEALSQAISVALDDALAAVGDANEAPDARVHTARKHLKRVRALAKLLHPRERRRLVQAVVSMAHSLGRLRDPVAELEAWSEFSGSLCPDSAMKVRQLLESRRALLAPPDRVRRRLRRSQQLLTLLRRSVDLGHGSIGACHADTPTSDAAADDQTALLRSLRRAYRNGRRAMHRARRRPSWKRLHALRRASKYHRYQLQFLEQFLGNPGKLRASRVARLGDELGKHHDLGAIARQVSGMPGFRKSSLHLGIRQQIRSRLHALQLNALRVAAKAFSERPKAFERRMHRFLFPAAGT
jgi:CHAD domain-containing protein